jgi:tetratricopeptide (TPR) repeat protein
MPAAVGDSSGQRRSLLVAVLCGAGVALAAVTWRRFHRKDNVAEVPNNGGQWPRVPPATISPMTPSPSAGWSEPRELANQAAVLPPVSDTPERRQAIELYQALKEQANSSFQRGALEESLQHYQDAVDVLAAIPGDADAEVIQLSQVVRANVVLVFLKMDRYEDARMLATFLLQDDVRPPTPLLCKVLFRRAAAMVRLGDIDGAVADLTAANHFSPNPDSVINDELQRVLKLQQQNNRQ